MLCGDQEVGPFLVLTGSAPVLGSLCSLCLPLLFFFQGDENFIWCFAQHQVGDKSGERAWFGGIGTPVGFLSVPEGTREGLRLFSWTARGV